VRTSCPASRVDASGIPLAWTVTGGKRSDVTQILPLVDSVPPVRGKSAGHGVGATSANAGLAAEIARRQTNHGSGLGRYRCLVERTFAWLHNIKRLLVRYDRRHEIHEASLAIARCLVCFRRLGQSF